MATLRPVLLSLILMASLHAPAARAAGTGVTWLMNEPVTLFDLGMFRLEQDLDRAARWLMEMGYAAEEPISGAYYDWRQRRIIAYVSIRDPYNEPAEPACRETYERIAREIVRGTPQGSRTAQIYLENLFLHEGPGNFGRPRSLGPELVDSVRFEITLLPSNATDLGGRRVRCAGRLDSKPEKLLLTVTN